MTILAPRHVVDYIGIGASECPDKAAVVLDDDSVSFAELNKRACRVGNGALGLGIGPGDHVAYVGRNAPALLEVFFGVLKTRATFVPINWRLAPLELMALVRDARPGLLFIDEDFCSALSEIWEGLHSFAKVVIVDRNARGYETWRDAQPGNDIVADHQDGDVVMQMYTSGTTGNPKGIRLTNANVHGWRRSEDGLGQWIGYQPADAIIAAAPFFHVGGLGWALAGLSRRATCVLMQGFDSVRMLELIERHHVTHVFAVPAVIDDLCEVQHRTGRNVSSVRLLHYGSASISPTVLQRAIDTFGCGFVQHYGMTEASGVVIMSPDQHLSGNAVRLKSCGVAAPGVEVRIVDESMHDVGVNAAGELCFRAAMVAESFWQDGEVKPMPLRNGWYVTGDVGMRDEEGFITLLDRKKDMIVSGGENVYPVEVERVLSAHPAIAECAVIGVPDPRWGEAVKALIVPRPGAVIDPGAIQAFARERIAGYKLPKTIEIRAQFPRTPAGKIRKDLLREPYWAGFDRRIN